MQNLVIVESPTKARTLSKFLGSKYQIEASMGHIRDLPKADLGVDVDNNFEPKYIIPRDKKKKVNELKKLAKGAKIIYLATDPDREGEAIAWHLGELIKGESGKGKGERNKKTSPFTLHPSPSIQRVVFHEITESAVKDAFKHPRELDLKLVDAQQARRILDRLVGYKLSPLLWKKVKRGLSAGRVQSVALRLIVERQREIDAFKALEYWSIEAELEAERVKGEGESFLANLIEINGQKIVLDTEEKKGFFISTEEEAKIHLEKLRKASYAIESVIKKEVRRHPQAPFTTSTLQQTAGNKLGFSAKKTMMIAQNLYEHGYITYMRTDSFNLSPQAISQARSLISSEFGQNYLPKVPRVFKSKSKNTQEAHEAIRPTKISLQSSDVSRQIGLTRDHARLYDLIWKRMVASQMKEAVLDQTTVDVKAKSTVDYLLRASGSVIKFDGWLKLYGVTQIEGDTEEDEENKKQVLPEVIEGEDLSLIELLPKQHFTEPPPSFTESSLIKRLEELGIGRPSTYAPILSTIQDRFYVEKLERKFTPTPLGLAVNDFLIKYFPEVFDFEFTAQMEDSLDEISRGERDWKKTIGEFYAPFEKKLAQTTETAEHVKLEVETVDKNCPECGKQLVIRTGKFGKFLACSGFPECKHTEALEEIVNVKCPEDGGDIIVRKTRKGKTFYGCKNYPNCKYASWTKPK